MTNTLVIVGRIVKIEECKEENSNKAVVTVAVPQSFKNIEGVYDTNFFECVLWNGIAQNTIEYCKKGDLIGIKGRLQRINTEKPVEIIAEKVTFLKGGNNE